MMYVYDSYAMVGVCLGIGVYMYIYMYVCVYGHRMLLLVFIALKPRMVDN